MVRPIRQTFLAAVLAIGALGTVACGPTDSTGSNSPPELSLSVGSEVEHVVGEGKVRIRMTATDPDGDALTFRVANKPEDADLQTFEQEALFEWSPSAKDVTEGEPLRLTFIVEDTHGGTSDRVVHLAIKPGNGRPEIVSSSTISYDVGSEDPVQFEVRVDDDDSEQVEISMLPDSAPKGARFEQTKPLSGTFTWKPSAKQTQRTTETVTFKADDGDFEPYLQDVSIIFRDGGQQNNIGGSQNDQECDQQQQAIQHEPLGTQSTSDDYKIEAKLSADAADKYDRAGVLWTVGWYPLNRSADELNIRDSKVEGQQLSFEIPNVSLSSGESKTVYYGICAIDSDAPADADDSGICTKGYYSFIAYPPSHGGNCIDDGKNIGDRSAAASISTQKWKRFRACEGSPDFHKFEVGAGETVTAYITYARGRTPDVTVFDSDMNKLSDALSFSECNGQATVEISHGTAESASPYFIRVGGDQLPYQSAAFVEGGACEPDANEQGSGNDGTSNATAANENPTFENLSICGDDVDVFETSMLKGDVFGAKIATTGEIDATLFAPSQSGNVGPSGTGTASLNEENQIAKTVEESGDYYLAVFTGGNTDVNDYDLIFDTTCRDADKFSDRSGEPPNHTRKDAALPEQGSHSGLKQCSGRPDWYEFAVFDGQDLSATIEPKEGASVDQVTVEAYDSSGNRIQQSVVVDGKRLVDFTASHDGSQAQYFIKVESSQDFRYSATFQRGN